MKTRFLIVMAMILVMASPPAPAVQQQTGGPELADEARERKVMERFLAVLEKSPRRGTALDRVYGFHVERGSLDAFLKTAQDKVAADPNDGASWLLIGLVEAQRGRDASAVEAFRKAEATRLNEALPAYYLGQALVLVGQPDAASEAFERALARKPARADLLDIYQALGRVYQRAHRNDKALAVWDRLEKAFPDDPRVQEQIAHALADEGQDAPALVRFEALATRTRDRFRQVQFAIEAAELKVKLGKSTDALVDFESLLSRLDPESWLYREVRRKVEEVFLRTDDLAGLATYYETWIKKTPDDIEAMARLGRTLASQGRVAEARKWLDQAVKLAPSRRELRLALIEQLVQDRKINEAASQYEALAKLEPNNPDVVRDWGRLLLRDTSRPELDRKKAAAGVWRRLAPDDAKDALTIAQAADLFRQAELNDEAIALYLRAIKLAPESSQYREYLGEYYHALKRPTDALATWRGGVSTGRNAKTLGRLGEVLAGFGYRTEAVEPLTEACRLEPDDFDLRLKLADLKLDLDKPLEALPEIEKAEKVAAAEEQAEAVLERLIRAYQMTSTMASRIEALQKSVATTPTAAGWTRLARLLEADQKSTEAARAIGEATKLDPKSVAAWIATARLREASGDLLGSAEALRTLTNLDRRSRTDYLTGIAKLEARLGRKAQALQAGRDLLAAAPGNPENHQFFAELCFQLGEPDEGLDSLRRAARANPSDPKAMLSLAENLARQFRTEEAIELYWRAFAKTPDVDGKLSIVARMADQYLQRNQLDRLLSRLERELREPNQQRELSLSLAQAHAASGDYATARLELERLLATNTRDTSLLAQLSNLAEQEGDIPSAAKYQKQALDIAPSPEGTGRLAQLYLKSGELSEAEAVWSRLAGENDDPARVLSSIDSLLAHGKNETALAIIERLLVKQPSDWDALYREGVALEALGKFAEAARRFRSILDLKLVDDEPSLSVKARPSRNGKAAVVRKGSSATPTPNLVESRIYAAWQIRTATKLEGNESGYGNGNSASIWTPSEFAQARMAANSWLYSMAKRDEKQTDYLKACQQSRDKSKADPRPHWDFYYLQLVRSDGPATFEAATDLIKLLPGDPSAEYAYLSALPERAVDEAAQPSRQNSDSETEAVDKTPPLSVEELDRVVFCYHDLRKKRPELAPTDLLMGVSAELKRAKRDQEAEAFYKEAIASSDNIIAVDAAITLAASNGSVDDLFALQDRSDRLNAGKGSVVTNGNGNGNEPEHADAFAAVMNKRADAKAYGDVRKVLDRYLASIRSSEAIGRRARSHLGASAQHSSYMMRVGKQQNYIQIDYPEPNLYYDYQAIQILRNAFELYKRDDLLSDLTAYLQAEVDRVPESQKIYPILASAYVAWWNDDKDEAVGYLTRAVESARGDVDLRLGLAEIQSKRGEPGEALELVDAVEPLDQKTMQRREVMALRLAVLSGDVERARKASERLFGLRLDSDTQLQLAAQMNQLGMHELSEAVLGRARRRAGGNTSSLVALMLQYQQAGKSETAFQIANQILRASTNSSTASNNSNARQHDYAKTEAIQVFVRSGKLKELIDRAETQLKASPNSIQVLQSLADYYKADSQPEKVKETYARLIKTRPDNARLRFEIANDMVQAGDNAGAVENYSAAIKKDPSLYINQYWQVQNAYQQAGKLEDLAKLMDEIDLKPFAQNPWAIQQVVATLTQEEKTRELGMNLFRKLWKAHPDTRANLMANLDGDALWQLPEIYDYVREAVIPAPGKTITLPWESVDHIYSYNGDGKVTGMLTRLMEGSTKQNKLDGLAREIDEGLKRSPQWSGGKAIKAIILVRQGKVDEARPILEDLLAKSKEIPSGARMVIGQELDGIKPLQDIELKLYEGAANDEDNGMGYQYGPGKRLVSLYHAAGKDAEAREVVLKNARKPTEQNYGPGNQAYAGYQRMTNAVAYGQQMMELGYPADAVRFFEEILGDTEAIEGTKQVYGGQDQMVRQTRQHLDAALKGITDKNIVKTLLTLAPLPTSSSSAAPAPAPASTLSPKAKGKPGMAPVDLVLIVNPRELDKAVVTSLFSEALVTAVKTRNAEVIPQVKAALVKRDEFDPKDFSTAMAWALVAIAESDPAAISRTAAKLVELVDASPLDPIAADNRPNARQRADAARLLGLWLVARECLKHDLSRPSGLILEARALEAARRQTDNRWTLAMLREGGQLALDRGDQATAEGLWRQMLRQVLAPPSPSKAKKPATPTARPKVTRASMALLMIVAQSSPAPAAPQSPTANNGGLAVATMDRFDQACQIAKLASDHGMFALSAEAIRESLGAGPPIVPIAIDGSNPNMGRPRRRNGKTTTAADTLAADVEQRLSVLDASWTQHKMPAGLAYETLRAIVLPETRAGEVFLYPLPIAQGGIEKPQSVAAILVRRAVEAGQVDDLRRRVEARLDQPMAVVPSLVLAVQIAIVTRDEKTAVTMFQRLAEVLKRDTLQNTAELACHAAIPALDLPATSDLALPMVEAVAKTMEENNQNSTQTLGPLLLSIARRKFKAQKPDEARKTLLAYQDKMQESAARYSGDYSLYYRKQILATVAAEFARGGQMADTWEVLGRFADSPNSKDYGAEPSVNTALIGALRMMNKLPAPERYTWLKAWVLPTNNRKSIRSLAEFVPEDQAIPDQFGPMPFVKFQGVAATSLLLIEAAREAGKLDELAMNVWQASEAKVENGRSLLTLVQISTGQPDRAGSAIRDRVEELKKPPVRQEGTRRNASDESQTVEWPDYLIARAALGDASLNGPAETLTRTLIGQAQTHQNWMFLSRLRRDLAQNQAGRRGKLAEPLGPDPGLAHWQPITLLTAATHRSGSIGSVWAESEGIVSHITGPQSEYLVLNYPLAGKFEVSVDAFLGNWSEGQVSFDGLVFQADSGGSVFPAGHYETLSVPSRFANMGAYNRTTIQVEPGKLRVLVNGHLFHEETDPGSNSPWLALYSTQERQTAFRNVTITGAPEIPREVRMVERDRLEGWACGFYVENQPPRRTVGTIPPGNNGDGEATPIAVGDLNSYDWYAKDGVIVGNREAEIPSGSTTLPSRIYYYRPIRDGETITYEFLHEPGKTMAHPSLERLAFLIEPEGVRLHWMTDATEDDWTGLAIDNAVDLPEFRRGTGPIPLKPGEWNSASLKLENGVAMLDLNGVRIYEYPLEKANQRIFGFYHDKAKTEAKVRNLILRGDWPTTLPANLLTRRNPNPSNEDRRARGAVVEERFSLLASDLVLAEARKMTPERRYETLAAYVLVNPDHPAYRLRGDLTPTNPAPPVDGPLAVGIVQNGPGAARIASGGQIEAPVIELITTAKAIGKLDELAKRVESARPKPGPPGRGYLALLVLIQLAQDREAEALLTLRQLRPMLESLSDDTTELQRWPELVAASATLDRPNLRPVGMAMLDVMDKQWTRNHKAEWGRIVRPVRARGQFLAMAEAEASRPTVGADPKVPGWSPVSSGTAQTRGRGTAMPTWTFANGTWTHASGHHLDHLYLASPLRGNFEVECELTTFNYREAQIAYGAQTVAVMYDRKTYHNWHFGRFLNANPINPPLPDLGEWYRFKLAVQDGNYAAFVNGRKIHESRLPEEADPWLMISSKPECNGGARNIKITGSPTIPDSLRLSSGPTLRGWLDDYYKDDTSLWKKQNDEIVGLQVRNLNQPTGPNDRPSLGLKGSKQESVLKYHRPMLEDGEITYEFFYEPGKIMVHPALDRLTFLIEPDGLKIHWLTDAQYDRTPLSPENTTVEPDCRRGPASPPLNPGAWNRVKLAVAGDLATLTLNDVIVYERRLEPTNLRDFGLFHYADETEVRVRNVNYRGQWPRSIPAELLKTSSPNDRK